MKRRFQGNTAHTSDDLRLVRFLTVGATGLVVNNAALFVLTEIGGLHYLLSAVLATQCSTVWNYGLAEAWVFGDRRQEGRRTRRFLSYVGMNNSALALRGPILTAMVAWLGLHYVVANLVSLLALALIRYLISDRWIWTPPVRERLTVNHAYDIHGIIGILSTIPLPELMYFQIAELGRPPDIRLRLERRRGARASDQAIHYDDGLGKYGFEVSMALGECTEIQVSPLVKRSPHVLYTNVFEPLLRWIFVRKGYALVHGACIESSGRATLITARTDTGKTSTILQAIRQHQFSFLSDDMTILDRFGRVMSFPKPLTISAHTLKSAARADLSLKERLALAVQSRVHSRSGRRFALWLGRSRMPAATINALAQILVPPPKYAIDRLLPGVSIKEGATLSHVIQIERGEYGLEGMRHDAIVRALIRNGEDAYGFPPYPELAGPLSTWQGVDLHDREQEIIRTALFGRPAYRLRSENYTWWKELPAIRLGPSEGAPTLPEALGYAIGRAE